MKAQKYKQVTIELEREASKAEKEILADINKTFPKNELYVEKREDKITCNLRLLDLEKFKERINKLALQKNLKPRGLFSEMISRIESIKSYGVKSGRRLYVDYDKERKVKGRKQKTEDRGDVFLRKG